MNNLKYLIAALFIAICINGRAQDYKKEIESEFMEYLNSLVNMEFEKSVEYITPEIFEIIPKSQMIKMMEMTFNNPSIEFELKNPEIIKIENAQKLEDKFYALLTYTNQMNMKLLAEGEETEDEKKMRINLSKLSLEQTFGVENVKYDEETDFFEIQAQKDVYGISKNGLTDWKFIVIEKKQKIILEKILPKALYEKL